MWEIYVIGDADYISSVINALAMLSNSNVFMQLGALGLLIGVVFMVGSGFMNEGKLNPGPIFGSLIILLIMFSVTTTAKVVNVRSGDVQVVANVPIGPVAIGSIISQIGKTTTEIIQLAFSTPSMTEHGFFTPIKALVRMREVTADSEVRSAVDDPLGTGGSVKKTVVEYVSNCTYKAIEKGLINEVDLRRSNSLIDAMLWNSVSHETNNYINGPTGVPGTCLDVGNQIKAVVNAQYKEDLKELIDLRLRTTQAQYANGSYGGASPTDEAMQLVTSGAAAASDAALNSLLDRFLELGLQKRFEDDRLYSKAAVINDSVNARIESWQSESSVFEHFFLPTITFLEGLVFALCPFVAFAIGLGAKGIKVATTYAVIAVWVQVWMPMLAIVNHFTTLIATTALSSVNEGNNWGPASAAALSAMDGPIQTWLAVAGWLGSSVPFLAAAVIFGGGQLIGKLGAGVSGQGSTGSSAGMAAPATMNAMPSIKGSGGLTGEFTAKKGLQVAGGSGLASELSMGQTAQTTLSSLKSQANGRREDYVNAAQRELSKSDTANRVLEKMNSVSASDSTNTGQTFSLAKSIIKQIQDKGGTIDYSAAEIGAALAADWNSGNSVYGAVVKGLTGVSASAKASGSFKTGARDSRESTVTEGEGNEALEKLEQQRRQAVQADITSKDGNSLKSALEESGSENWRRASSDYEQFENRLASAQQRAELYGANWKIGDDQFAVAAYGDPKENGYGYKNETFQAVSQKASEMGITGDLQRQVGILTSGPGAVFANTEDGKAKAAIAGFARIMNGQTGPVANLDEDEKFQGLQMVDRIIGEQFGVQLQNVQGLYQPLNINEEKIDARAFSSAIRDNVSERTGGVNGQSIEDELDLKTNETAVEELTATPKIKEVDSDAVSDAQANMAPQPLLDQFSSDSEMPGNNRVPESTIAGPVEQGGSLTKEAKSNQEDTGFAANAAREVAGDLKEQTSKVVDGLRNRN